MQLVEGVVLNNLDPVLFVKIEVVASRCNPARRTKMLSLSPSADLKQPRIVDDHSLDVTLNHMRTKPEPEGRKSSVLSGMSSCRELLLVVDCRFFPLQVDC